MLAVCMTLIDNDKDQTSFEDFYFRNRQIAYAFAYKILNNSALAEEACANAFFSIAKCFKKIHNYSLHDMDAYLILELLETPVMRSTIRKIKIQHRLYLILRWKMSRVRIFMMILT